MRRDASGAEPVRRPLDAAAVRAALTGVEPWREVRVVAETGSTNDDVATAARAGADEGLVVVAELQSGGRGRLGRTWIAPYGSGLTFSVLLRPAVPADRWPWLPLLAGAAVADAVHEVTGLDVGVKWPNDLLVDGRKLAGLLAEVVDGGVVVGVGLNVTTTRDELPRDDATSIALEGVADADRGRLLVSVLRRLGAAYREWTASGGRATAVRAEYLARSATLGRRVAVTRPGGYVSVGEAVDVDEQGRLVVDSAQGRTALSAGEVTHVRPA